MKNKPFDKSARQEKFYAPFVAKPKPSKKERQAAFWAEEDWDGEEDDDEEDSLPRRSSRGGPEGRPPPIPAGRF